MCHASPVFIVIDALDENGDSSRSGLGAGSDSLPFHSFLGRHLQGFPPNFRILITSRAKPDIVKALPPSSSVRHMEMHDEELDSERWTRTFSLCVYTIRWRRQLDAPYMTVFERFDTDDYDVPSSFKLRWKHYFSISLEEGALQIRSNDHVS